jgi:DNA transformation protein and related proteins
MRFLNNGFSEYIVSDLLGDVPGIIAKRLFGSISLYRDGKIFAIVKGDKVFFKVSDKTKQDFIERGSKPFSYSMKNGRAGELTSYYELPAEILDDRDEFLKWFEKSPQ